MKKTFIKIVTFMLLAAMTCAMLASCGGPNANPDKAVEALKENDYVAEKIDSKLGLLVFSWAGDGLECVVTGLDKDLEGVTIFYYESADAANNAWEKVEEHESDKDDDYVLKKSGKMIYVGTAEAIKAAK